MIKRDGQWHEVDWATALGYAAHALEGVKTQHGVKSIGMLVSPNSSMEEQFMLSAIAQGLGGASIDSRLRQIDFAADAGLSGAPWLGMAIEEVNHLQRLLLIGSFLRKDHPLLAARVRAATKQGLALSSVHAVDDDLLMPVANKALLAPSQWPRMLALILKQLRSQLALEAKPMPAVAPDMKDWVDRLAASASSEHMQLAKSIAQSLQSGDRKAVWIGSAAKGHPQYSRIHALAQAIAEHCEARLGVMVDGANAVGAWQLGLQSVASKQSNAQQMIAQATKAFLLYQVEPEFDHAAANASLDAMAGADTVIALSAYRSEAMMQYADCLLPLASFTESSGTVVNMEGRRQSYSAVVKPYAQARPGWKVLRVLADLLQIPSLAFETIEDLRQSAFAKADACALSNQLQHVSGLFDDDIPNTGDHRFERLAEVPIYACDGVVRRAPSLQSTRDARLPALRVHPSVLNNPSDADSAHGITKAYLVEVSDGRHKVQVQAEADAGVSRGVLRMPMAIDANRGLPLSEAQLSLRVIASLPDARAVSTAGAA
jgi:NADH-quinone oxidoreductase subunit G